MLITDALYFSAGIRNRGSTMLMHADEDVAYMPVQLAVDESSHRRHTSEHGGSHGNDIRLQLAHGGPDISVQGVGVAEGAVCIQQQILRCLHRQTVSGTGCWSKRLMRLVGPKCVHWSVIASLLQGNNIKLPSVIDQAFMERSGCSEAAPRQVGRTYVPDVYYQIREPPE
ncbi:MAG: hypothetical protein FRX49_06938 [Trebouxia sp. A1-2]|nr:MAG: hypothetical protein FRX49_06938 [Trebouxia sp. A1-2]